MNPFGVFASTIFTVTVLGGVAAWFYTAYNGLRFVIVWGEESHQSLWRSFWLSRTIWFRSDISQRARAYRSKAFKGIVAFLCCLIFGLIIAHFGEWLGGQRHGSITGKESSMQISKLARDGAVFEIEAIAVVAES